ncbi:MAG TPA: hypothetical protein DEO73_09270 [Pantoea sp.]|nr:hypothetical protein [Pantoea sp.]
MARSRAHRYVAARGRSGNGRQQVWSFPARVSSVIYPLYFELQRGWLRVVTAMTYFCKRLGSFTPAAFLHLKLFRV